MLMCRGLGPAAGRCQWRDVCSRYVLGRAVKEGTDISAIWISRCSNGKKFIRVGSDK